MSDDTPSMLERHYGNLVQIKRFKGDPEDQELFKLMRYLIELKEEGNVRVVDKRCLDSMY